MQYFDALHEEKKKWPAFWEQVDQVLEKAGAFLSMSVTLSGEAEKSEGK
jgi:hypothetical protein